MRLVLALASLALATPALAEPPQTYGAGAGKAPLVKISALKADPEGYVGKTVRVAGLVVDVCPTRGCWIELAGDKEFESLMVKVKDGEVVFPMTAKGKQAEAEGVFTRIDIPAERVLEIKKHEAEEKGLPFDPKTVKAVPMVMYRIQATGAVIR